MTRSVDPDGNERDPSEPEGSTMNTMHELLMPELIELKMAQRLAEAEADRTIRRLREATGSSRQWHFGLLRLRLPRLGGSAPRTA